MRRFELILITTAIIGMIMKFFFITGGGILVTLSLMILANFYFFLGFAYFNNIPFKDIFKRSAYANVSRKRIIAALATGMALSISIIGILFKLQHWPGQTVNLQAGAFLTLLVLIIGIIRYLKSKEIYHKRIIPRVFVYGLACLLCLSIPDLAFIKVQFNNHQKYIEAFEAYQKKIQIMQKLRSNYV